MHAAYITSETTSRFGLILLAAGGSSRMRQPKQLLPVAGRPLVEHAVLTALAAPFWPVVVVTGAASAAVRQAVRRHPVLIADNPAWAEGMASSLRAGLAVLASFSPRVAGAVIALADQPALSAEILTRLLDTHTATGCSIVAARYAGRRGAPALFSRSHFAALCALTGDAGARQLIAAAPPADVASLDLPALATDLDTPEDYAALLAQDSPPR